MHPVGPQHQRQGRMAHQWSENRIAEVQTAGQRAERRQNDPLPIGGEAATADAGAKCANAGAGMKVTGDLAAQGNAGRLVDEAEIAENLGSDDVAQQ